MTSNTEALSPSSIEARIQKGSAALYQRALKVMPGGCSRNTILRKPHPLYVEFGEGCYVTDIEGTRRIDFANNMASLIHGHSHPEVVAAVGTQLQKGTAFMMATEVEVKFAEHMCGRNPGFEKIRFVNSGTEAVMACLKASRAFTGRPKIAKVEGAYHGLYDFAEISQTAKPENWGNAEHPSSVPVAHGTPASTLDEVIVIPYNDAEKAIAILDEHADELACVLVDLMAHRIGLIKASDEYVNALRKWTQDNDVLLVCDEVITLRATYGGAQTKYPITADLTAMGKVIGGGFPVGAIAGREDIMDVMNPLAEHVLFPHSGTFSANPISMTAGLSTMRLFDQSAVNRLNRLTKLARVRIAEAIEIADVPACVTGGGSMFRLHMKPEPPKNYRDSFASADESHKLKILLDHAFDNGVMLINTGSGALSTAMTEAEIDILAQVMLEGFRKIKKEFSV
jgi:glutamate-1-semialdehyde 2,1-aminomutase